MKLKHPGYKRCVLCIWSQILHRSNITHTTAHPITCREHLSIIKFHSGLIRAIRTTVNNRNDRWAKNIVCTFKIGTRPTRCCLRCMVYDIINIQTSKCHLLCGCTYWSLSDELFVKGPLNLSNFLTYRVYYGLTFIQCWQYIHSVTFLIMQYKCYSYVIY